MDSLSVKSTETAYSSIGDQDGTTCKLLHTKSCINCILLKFSLLCELLPYYGYLDEWCVMLTSICKSSKSVWKNNLSAFELLGRSYIRDSKVLPIILAEKIEQPDESQVPKGYSYYKRLYSFNSETLRHLQVIYKLIGRLNSNTLLCVQGIKYIPKEEDHSEKIDYFSSFRDFQILLKIFRFYKGYLNEFELKFGVIEETGKLSLQKCFHSCLSLYCDNIFKNLQRSLEFVNENDCKSRMECFRSFSKLNICTCYAEYFVKQGINLRLINTKVININVHSFSQDLEIICEFISNNSITKVLLHNIKFMNEFCSVSKLSTTFTNAVLMGSSIISPLVIGKTEIEVEFELVKNIDYKNEKWFPLKIKGINKLSEFMKISIKDASLDSLIAKVNNYLTQNSNTYFLLIPKSSIKAISNIRVQNLMSLNLNYVKKFELNINGDKIVNYDEITNCLKIIPKDCVVSILTNKKTIEDITSNEQIIQQFHRFKTDEINCAKWISIKFNRSSNTFILYLKQNKARFELNKNLLLIRSKIYDPQTSKQFIDFHNSALEQFAERIMLLFS